MAKPNHDELTAALDLCESPKCAGHPEQCDSCYAIAFALAGIRLKERRKARKKMKADLLAALNTEMGRYGRQAKYSKEHPTSNAAKDIKAEGYWFGTIDGLNKVYRHVRGSELLGSVSLPWESGA